MKNHSKKRILVIEDEYNDYRYIKESLIEEEYEVLPNLKNEDEFLDYRNGLIESINGGYSILENYTVNLVNNNKPNAIVCDIKLGDKDEDSGKLIIKIIRQNFSDDLLQHFIPIIAVTKYSDAGSEVINLGVIHRPKFFSTEQKEIYEPEKNIFLTHLGYMIRQNERTKKLVGILKPSFDEYKEILIDHNRMISENINGLELLIKNNHNEISSTLSTLFLLSYEGLSSEKQKKFRENFEQEITNIIGKEKFENLKCKSKWKEFKKALSELKSSGGIEKFAKCSIDLMEEAELFNFTGGKILSIGLKGIIGVACS